MKSVLIVFRIVVSLNTGYITYMFCTKRRFPIGAHTQMCIGALRVLRGLSLGVVEEALIMLLLFGRAPGSSPIKSSNEPGDTRHCS